MWPFSKSSEEENCNHEEWKDMEDEVSGSDRLHFDDGQPYAHNLTISRKQCKNCGYIVWDEKVKEKVYFSVEDRYITEDD